MRRLVPLLLLAACGAKATPPAEPPAPSYTPTAFAVKVSGTGRPVIFIPGLACSGEVWDGTVAHLGGRVQAHVLTLAGFGGQKPIPPPMLSTVRDEIITYVRENRLQRPILVGHSLGGAMTYWLAATEPDLFGGAVVVDGLPFFPAARDPKTTLIQAEGLAKMMRDQMVSLPPEQFGAAMRGFLASMITRPADLDQVVANATRSDPTAVGQAFYELFTTDLRPGLRRIRVHVLIIAASDVAGVTRPQLEAAWHAQTDSIPQKRLVIVEGAKHFVMLDQPEKFYALLDEELKR